MKIGFSIFLIAVGAILSFAVKDSISGVNLAMIGWVLMGAGALGLIITMILMTTNRKSIRTETHSVDGVPVSEATSTATSKGLSNTTRNDMV